MESQKRHVTVERLDIVSLNVHGVRGKEAEIEALASKCHVLCVCETWIRPQDSALANEFNESVSVLQDHGGWRGQGGVAIRLSPLINYSVVLQHAQSEYQTIVIKFGDTNIAATYIAPGVRNTVFVECLDKIRTCTMGKVTIIGDLNTRHLRWDTTSNSQGRWLVKWAKMHDWSIHAPEEPTFSSHMGTSTVDMVLTRNVVAQETKVLHGPWDGCSDHFAITTHLFAKPLYRLGISSILHRHRHNTKYLERARTVFPAELPSILKEVSKCTNAESLEEVYTTFKNVTLQPWAPARKYRPKRFRYFWNHHLEYLKHQRSKKYKLATTLQTSDAWYSYQNVDRRIRSVVRQAKMRSFRKQTALLGSKTNTEGVKIVKSVLRNASQSATREEGSESLDPSSFTKYLATPEGRRHAPAIVPFSCTPQLVARVIREIQHAKPNKASGRDELFTEAFKVAPRHFAEVLCAIWTKCSELGYLIRDWRTAIMVPIHKHGPKLDPANYRPISLLSHGRQMLSAAIGKFIQEQYEFHPTQLGFREHTGTETAIVRHAHNYLQGLKYTAVLDLKSAYDRVPREILMARVREKLPKQTADMIALELQPMTIVTKGDHTGTSAQVSIGVPQGGKSSPPLYNLQQDTYAEKMDEAKAKWDSDPLIKEEVEISLFADDVKVQAASSKGLQMALDVSTAWAEDTKATWSVSKCHILEPETVSEPGKYELAGKQIEVVEAAEYLGVSLKHGRIDTTRNVSRVRAAIRRLGLLKSIGVNRKRVPSAQLVAICRTFVYPVADYATHLLSFRKQKVNELFEQLELLDYRVAEYCLGCIPKDPGTKLNRNGRIGGRLPRHLKIARLPDWLQRIRMRLCSLGRRLRKRARWRSSDVLARQDALIYRAFRDEANSPKDMTKVDVHKAWECLCRRRRRQVPVPKTGLLPILYEHDRHVRDTGIKWFTGSFPGNPEDLKMLLGSEVYQRVKVRIETGMQMEKWSAVVRKRTIESIHVFLEARGEIETGQQDTSRGRKRPWGETNRDICTSSRKRRKGM